MPVAISTMPLRLFERSAMSKVRSENIKVTTTTSKPKAESTTAVINRLATLKRVRNCMLEFPS